MTNGILIRVGLTVCLAGILSSLSCKKGKETYTLSISPKTKYGSVTSDPGGIHCGGGGNECMAEFDEGAELTLTATANQGYAQGGWSADCSSTTPKAACILTMDEDRSAGKSFTDLDIDEDDDGLIDIHDLDMLSNIRHGLAGIFYRTGADAEVNNNGISTKAKGTKCSRPIDGAYLCGYELMRDLDFANPASYADGNVNKDWRPLNASGNVVDPNRATNAGFDGIGTDETPDTDSAYFKGIFEGNGHTISNLYIRNTLTRDEDDPKDTRIFNTGLFKAITENARLRNLRLENARVYGNASDREKVGALVGFNLRGWITGCIARTGSVHGGAGNKDWVGGLVGYNYEGSIIASHTALDIHDTGKFQTLGGLVGLNEGSIIASFSMATVYGGAGTSDVGGLVGLNEGSSIIASFSMATVHGGAGTSNVGGLVGLNYSSIIASFSTATVNGGTGDETVGGLVGYNRNRILASYAAGDVDGGIGDDNVGKLVGGRDSYLYSPTNIIMFRDTITTSYGFGSATGETIENSGTTYPDSVSDANGLTAPGSPSGAVGTEWNDADENTLDTWDFGTSSQPPALKYADYDGTGSADDVDYCDLFPKKIPGTNTPIVCGTTFLPGQGR